MKKTLLIFIFVFQVVAGFAQEMRMKGKTILKESEERKEVILPDYAARKDVDFTDRLEKKTHKSGMSLKGSIHFIGNNILSKSNAVFTDTSGITNDSVDMQYINIDSDVAGIFSSSKATLEELPNCAKVVYAGLYWAGIYPYKHWPRSGYYTISRDDDFDHIKFKTPTSSGYEDIVADDVIYKDKSLTAAPYVCYKDVTEMVQSSGEYFVANMKATRGKDLKKQGSSAGWTIVIIYEDNSDTNKRFYVYDGFTKVAQTAYQSRKKLQAEVPITIKGFKTPAAGPVRVSFINAALEGDQGIPGDDYQIQKYDGSYKSIGAVFTPKNSKPNFFDSSIYKASGTRVPSNKNNLGFDVAQLDIPSSWGIFKNSQEKITVKFTTTGDVYFPFLNAMSVEVVEPDIELVMTVDNGNAGSNNLRGKPLKLKDYMWYHIDFRNKGTDSAKNTIITDVLPRNVILQKSKGTNGALFNGVRYNIELPKGVKIHKYIPKSPDHGNCDVIEFAVDDNLLEVNVGPNGTWTASQKTQIRFYAQVQPDCEKLVGVCSNIIQNQASVYTEGVEGGATIDNKLSFNGFDECGNPTLGASNILVDFDKCARKSKICGDKGVTLKGGTGYETYTWTKEGSTNVLGTNQELLVTSPGVYTVSMVASEEGGCLNLQKIITVEDSNHRVNPLIQNNSDGNNFQDKVLSCEANSNEKIVEVYLCGNSEKEIELSFDSTTTVLWQKLTDDAIPNKDHTCPSTDGPWKDYTSGSNDSNPQGSMRQVFSKKGQYRLVLIEGKGCNTTYYFNIYEGGVDPKITPTNIYCGAPGSIDVDNVVGYQYGLATGKVTSPPKAMTFVDKIPDGGFPINTAGEYTVFLKSTKTSCLSYSSTNVNKIDMEVSVDKKPILCSADIGALNIKIDSDIPAQYHYEVREGSADAVAIVGKKGPTNDKNFKLDITTSGKYYIKVYSDTESKCLYEGGPYRFRKPKELIIKAIKSKDISCGNGLINLTVSGGTPDNISGYTYAILNYTPGDGATKKAIDIPANPPVFNPGDLKTSSKEYKDYLKEFNKKYSDYLNLFTLITDNEFNVYEGQQGTYQFVAFDNNRCMATSQEVTVTKDKELKFNYEVKDVSCKPGNNGEIIVTTVTPPGLQGFSLEYSKDGLDVGDDKKVWGTSNSFSKLAPGDYVINVRATKNNNICDFTESLKIKTTEQATGSAKLSQDIDCEKSGTITFETPKGGNGEPYSYGIKKEGTSGDMPFTGQKIKKGLTAGTYKLAIKDKESCTIDLHDIVVNELQVIPPYKKVNVEYDCDGKGIFKLVPTKTTDLELTYVLKDSKGKEVKNNSTSPNFLIGYPKGTYTVTVSATRACPVDVSVIINGDNFFDGKILNHKDATCNGSDDGKITILADNYADGKFEYSINGGSSWDTAIASKGTSFEILGLAGSSLLGGKEYSILIKKNGCEKEIGKQKIKEPTQLQVNHKVKVDPTCLSGGDKATIRITGSGGTKPYKFSIDKGLTWSKETNDSVEMTVPQGDVEIQVIDGNGCTLCGCDGNSFINGGFEEFPAGTIAPDSYKNATRPTWVYNDKNLIPGWDTTEMSNGVIESWFKQVYKNVTTKAFEGKYFMELNSETVATLYQSFCTQEGDIITWSVAHRGRKGVDEASVIIGGTIGTALEVEKMVTGRKEWKVYSGTYTVPANQPTTLIGFQALTSSTGSVKEGNYIDDVKISVVRPSCKPAVINIPEAPKPTVDINNSTECYKGDGKAEIKVTAKGGAPNYQFSKDGGIAWETPNPVDSKTHTFKNLSPDTKGFNIKVKDSKGCISIDDKKIKLPTQVVASLETRNDVTCTKPGLIKVKASGGIKPLVYAFIKDGALPNDADFTRKNSKKIPLADIGTYTVYVRDNGGVAPYCDADVKNIVIKEASKPKLTVTPTQPKCAGEKGSFTVEIEGGKENFTLAVTGETTKNNISYGKYPYADKKPGKYTVKIIDENGCDVEESFTLVEPIILKATVKLTQDYTCTEKGIIKFTSPLGGTPPYKYSIDGGSNYYDIDAIQFTNLTDGTYNSIIKDNNSCTQPLDKFVINELPIIPKFIYSDEYDCEGKGIITLRRADRNTDLTGFTFKEGTVVNDNPDGVHIFKGLEPGVHTIIISKDRACDITVLVKVKKGQKFTAGLVETATAPVLCKGGTTGTAKIKVENFGSTYVYEVTDSTGKLYKTEDKTESPYIIKGLKADTYTIKVYPKGNTNAACVESFNVEIKEPTDDLKVKDPSIIKGITCSTPTEATISGKAEGGTPGYTFTVQIFKKGSFLSDLTKIPPGTHNIKVIDGNNCEDTKEFTIEPASKPTHKTKVLDCYEGVNLDITITAADGKAPYTFSIDNGATWKNPSNIVDTSMLIPAGPGTHKVIVKDANGCKSIPTEVIIKKQLTGSTVSTKDVTCKAGKIVVKAEGGHGEYSFQLLKGSVLVGSPKKPAKGTSQESFEIADGEEDKYSVKITDAKNCEYTVKDIVIGKIVTATAIATPKQPNCDDDLGSIDLVITNGLPPFTIEVAGGTTTVATQKLSGRSLNIPNLGSGTYTITITDDNNCKVTPSPTAIIAVPSSLTGTAVKDKEYTCTEKGTIVFDISGGTPPYSYSIDGGANWEKKPDGTFEVQNGTYNLLVKDANGCTKDDFDAVIFDALPIIPDFKSSLVYTCEGQGNVTLTPNTGIAKDYNYSIVATGAIQPLIKTSSEGTFEDLVPDTYTVTVTQDRACDKTITFTVKENKEFTAKFSGSKVDIKCKGDNTGKITFEADNYSQFDGAQFFYTVDGGDEKSSTTSPVTVKELKKGTHTILVYIKDKGVKACEKTITETLSEPKDALVLGAVEVIKEVTCLPDTGATIKPSGSGGTPSYTFEVKYPGGNSNGEWTDDLTNIPAGTNHKIRLTDANNCTAEGNFNIVDKKPVVFTITPTKCFEGTGEVVVNVTEGNGDYEFSLTGGVHKGQFKTPKAPDTDSYTFDNLQPGIEYIVNVKDGKGCEGTNHQRFTLKKQLLATAEVKDISCGDGVITLTIKGGDAPYTYIIDSEDVSKLDAPTSGYDSFDIDHIITVKTAGIFDIWIKDNSGCTVKVPSVEVKDIPDLDFVLTGNNAKCQGDKGSIKIEIPDVSIGVPPYKIEVKNTNGYIFNKESSNNVLDLFELEVGPITTGLEYTVKIVDNNGCENTHKIKLQDAPNLVLDTDVFKPDCGTDYVGNETKFGFSFINIPALPSPASGTGTYSLEYSAEGGTDGSWTTNTTFTHLNVGTRVYPAVRIVYKEGGKETITCEQSFDSFLIPYAPISLVTELNQNTSGDCTQGASATVTVDKIFRGSPPYQYGWSKVEGVLPSNWGPETNDIEITIDNLSPSGRYEFYVRDRFGCIGVDHDFINKFPVQIKGTKVTDACDTSSGSSFSFDISEGKDIIDGSSITWNLFNIDDSSTSLETGSFVYDKSTFTPITTNTNYGAGIYYITIEFTENGKKCLPIESNNIETRLATPITGTAKVIKNQTCKTPGQVLVSDVKGGYGGFKYATQNTLYSGTPADSEYKDINPIKDLHKGTYSIWVMDKNGCKKQLNTVTIELEPEPDLTLKVNNCSKNKTITALVSNPKAKPPFKFSKDGGVNWTSAIDDRSYTFEGLEPKDKFTGEEYKIVVEDANECPVDKVKTIYPSLEYGLTVTKDLYCTGNAEITVQINAGSGDYTYKVSRISGAGTIYKEGEPTKFDGRIKATGKNELIFEATEAGEYEISIVDNNNKDAEGKICPVVKEVEVDELIEPIFTTEAKNVTCNGGSNGYIIIKPTKGVKPITYVITNASGKNPYKDLSKGTTKANLFGNLPAGTYEITGTAANGCSFIKSNILINEPSPINITKNDIDLNQFACAAKNNKENASIVVKVGNITLPKIAGESDRTIKKVIFYKDDLTGEEVQNGTNPKLVITDVNGGNYFVEVHDNEGCSGTYGPVTINPYNKLKDITINDDQPNYCGTNNGAQITVGIDAIIPDTSKSITDVDITVKGPSGSDYEIAVTETKVSPYKHPFKNLTQGEYTIIVKNNDTDCELSTKYLVGPTPSDQYQVEVTVTDKYLCTAAGTDSEVKFNLSSNYSGKYTYVIYKGTKPSGTVVSGTNIATTEVKGEQVVSGVLASGDYYIEATMVDKPFCPITSKAFTITAPTLDLTVSGTPTKPQCNGGLGFIKAVANGGYGNYEFSLLDGNKDELKGYQSSTLFTDLSVGKYYIKVKDINGCDKVSSEIEIENSEVVTLTYVINDNACDDSKKGEIILTGSGGTGTGYNYVIENKSGNKQSNSTGSFSNLDPGTYKLFVQDANGCEGTRNGQEIVVGKPLVFTLSEAKKIDCNISNSKGKIVLTIKSGTGPYAYEVTGSGDSTVSYTELKDGATFVNIYVEDSEEYTVVVYDKGNRTSPCSKQDTFKLQPKLEPVFTTTPISETCFDADNGKIVITPTDNGVLPLEYTISPEPTPGYVTTITGNVFENLPANAYTIVGVSTTNKCATTINNIKVDQPKQIAFDKPLDAKFECSADTNKPNGAVISVDKSTIIPAVGIYTKVVFIDSNNNVVQSGPSFEYTSTQYGGMIYTVQVYNDKGCFGTQTATVLPYNALEVATVNVTKAIDCNTGDNIEVTYTSNPVDSIDKVDFTIDNEAGDYTYKGTENNTGKTKGVFTNLIPDTYIITVTNPSTGCSISAMHIVEDAPKYELAVKYIDGNVCTVGAKTGEISFDFTTASPEYTGAYSWNLFKFNTTDVVKNGTGLGGTPTSVTGLEAGEYQVEIDMGVNSPFCKGKSVKITINEPKQNLDLELVETPPTCIGDSDGIITAVGKEGYGSYEYSLSGMGLDISYRKDGVFGGLVSGKYTIGVKDANGCESSKDIDFDDPKPVDFTFEKFDNVCTDEGGKIIVTATGGNTKEYNYYLTSKSDGVQQTSIGIKGVFNELKDGEYTIEVENTVGCKAEKVADVTINPDLEFAISKKKLIDCKVGNDGFGIVEISIIKGSGNYAYEVSGAKTITNTPFTGESTTFEVPVIGIYTVKVYDTSANPECAKEQKIEFVEAVKPDVVIEPINISCKGSEDGRVIVTAKDNGTLPLEYTIEPAHGTGFIEKTSSFDGLKPDQNYVVKVKSINNECVFESDVIVLSEPDPIDVSNKAIDVVQFGCSGNDFNQASIKVNLDEVTGGTKTTKDSYVKVEIIDPYDKLVLDSDNDFEYTVTDKTGGTYKVIVYDAHNCSGVGSVVIKPFNELDEIQITQTKAISCDSGENIEVGFTSNPLGKITTVEFTITDGDEKPVVDYPTAITGSKAEFNDLAPGLYIITVTEPNSGCSINDVYQVKEEPKFNLTVKTIKGSVCSEGGSDGVLSLDFATINDESGAEVPSYSGSYTYTVYDKSTDLPLIPSIKGTAKGGVPVEITGLPEGNFYVVVQMNESPACKVVSTSIGIVKPDVLLSVSAATTLIPCTNASGGELILKGSGGFGDYEFKVVKNGIGSAGVEIQSFSNNRFVKGLDEGNYLVTVKDFTGCTATLNVSLKNPVEIKAEPVIVNNIKCSGDKNGVIEVKNVSGGQGSPIEYLYSLTYPEGITSAPQKSPVFDKLFDGDYIVTVYTGFGCSNDFPIKLESKTKVISSPKFIGRITCKIDKVQVTVDGEGGVPPYEYSIDGLTWQTTNTFKVGVGKHDFYVKDSEECISEPSPIVIEDIKPLILTIDSNLSITKTTCNGSGNAVLSVKAEGGVGDYTYELLDESGAVIKTQTKGIFRSNPDIGFLIPAGNYKVRVSSGSDCPDGADVTVDFVVTEPEVIEAEVIVQHISCNGESDGFIQLENVKGGNGEFTYRINTDPDNRFQESAVFENLVAGIYTIIVQDAQGCFKEYEVEVKEPKLIEYSLEGDVTQQECETDPSPSFTVSIVGGTAPYKVSLNGVTPIELPTNPDDVYTYTFEDGKDGFEVKAGQSYTVIISDVNGCRANGAPLIIQTAPTLDLHFDLVDEYDCTDTEFVTISAVTADITGKTGIKFTIYNNTYDADLDDNSESILETNSTGIFNVPTGTTYYVEGNYDGNKCKPVAKEIKIDEITGQLGFEITRSSLNTIVIKPIAGSGDYEYSINGGDFSDNNQIIVTETQTYTVTIRDLVTGCSYTETFEGEFLSIVTPNFFTPDGDGTNDYWYPMYVEEYHKLKVYIFDRYGRKLAIYKGINQGWDGTYNSAPLPRGDYWYTIYYRELSGEEKKLMGHFTLYRKQ